MNFPFSQYLLHKILGANLTPRVQKWTLLLLAVRLHAFFIAALPRRGISDGFTFSCAWVSHTGKQQIYKRADLIFSAWREALCYHGVYMYQAGGCD